MLNVLFSAKPDQWDVYQAPLLAAFEQVGISVNLSRDHAPDTVDYIIFAPNGPVTDFTPYTKARAVMSLWAGVETVADNPTLTQPLTRMVDLGLTRGMVEWVTGHVLRHHLGMDAHIMGQDGVWRDSVVPPLASQRPVTILGLGALGTACGQALSNLGFPVTGWSRRRKNVPDIQCLHGASGCHTALSTASILILLLPQTTETTGIMSNKTLAQLPKGAVIINPGRGPLIDDAALLAALDSGHIDHATLDVFNTEPLPADHRFWGHPNVTVTPHIASVTRPRTASEAIAQNILRDQSGDPLIGLVDRTAGY